MKKDGLHHWVFRAHVQDRAGALTSIASAFSNRGISIETVVGHGAEEQATHDGTVVMTFRCTEEDKDMMVRVVRRLSKVTRLQEYPYDSHSLRKAALIRVNRRLTPKDVAGEESFLTCELMSTDPESWVYLVAGAPNQLDPVLRRLEGAGEVSDIVYTVLGL
ncbi:MAG: ACT domain-containing protein [Phycisphaerae bacterium]|nr:ACT domain-containing protein [Phycisphaerae bacterium]